MAQGSTIEVNIKVTGTNALDEADKKIQALINAKMPVLDFGKSKSGVKSLGDEISTTLKSTKSLGTELSGLKTDQLKQSASYMKTLGSEAKNTQGAVHQLGQTYQQMQNGAKNAAHASVQSIKSVQNEALTLGKIVGSLGIERLLETGLRKTWQVVKGEIDQGLDYIKEKQSAIVAWQTNIQSVQQSLGHDVSLTQAKNESREYRLAAQTLAIQAGNSFDQVNKAILGFYATGGDNSSAGNFQESLGLARDMLNIQDAAGLTDAQMNNYIGAVTKVLDQGKLGARYMYQLQMANPLYDDYVKKSFEQRTGNHWDPNEKNPETGKAYSMMDFTGQDVINATRMVGSLKGVSEASAQYNRTFPGVSRAATEGFKMMAGEATEAFATALEQKMGGDGQLFDRLADFFTDPDKMLATVDEIVEQGSRFVDEMVEIGTGVKRFWDDTSGFRHGFFKGFIEPLKAAYSLGKGLTAGVGGGLSFVSDKTEGLGGNTAGKLAGMALLAVGGVATLNSGKNLWLGNEDKGKLGLKSYIHHPLSSLLGGGGANSDISIATKTSSENLYSNVVNAGQVFAATVTNAARVSGLPGMFGDPNRYNLNYKAPIGPASPMQHNGWDVRTGEGLGNYSPKQNSINSQFGDIRSIYSPYTYYPYGENGNFQPNPATNPWISTAPALQYTDKIGDFLQGAKGGLINVGLQTGISAINVLGMEDSYQRDVATAETLGQGIGGVAGAAIGTALAGPIGAMVGSQIGMFAGQALGDFAVEHWGVSEEATKKRLDLKEKNEQEDKAYQEKIKKATKAEKALEKEQRKYTENMASINQITGGAWSADRIIEEQRHTKALAKITETLSKEEKARERVLALEEETKKLQEEQTATREAEARLGQEMTDRVQGYTDYRQENAPKQKILGVAEGYEGLAGTDKDVTQQLSRDHIIRRMQAQGRETTEDAVNNEINKLSLSLIDQEGKDIQWAQENLEAVTKTAEEEYGKQIDEAFYRYDTEQSISAETYDEIVQQANAAKDEQISAANTLLDQVRTNTEARVKLIEATTLEETGFVISEWEKVDFKTGAVIKQIRARFSELQGYTAVSGAGSTAGQEYVIDRNGHASSGSIYGGGAKMSIAQGKFDNFQGLALVGEEGPEYAYGSGKARLLGADGPEIAFVRADEKILPNSVTQRILSKGIQAGKSLLGFADGKWPTLGDNPFQKNSPKAFQTVSYEGFEIVNTEYNRILEKVKAEYDRLEASSFGEVSGDVSSWAEKIREVAHAMHTEVTDAQVQHILRQIQHESGGSQNVVNNWDSNAAKGTPSKGLLQYIDPTFHSYMVPGHTNINSGIDQLYAFFNNRNWATDLPANNGGWGPTGGRRFAKGGRPPLNEVSLVGEEGPELFVPDTKGTIVPNRNLQRGERNITFSPTIQVYTDSTQSKDIARDVAREVQRLFSDMLSIHPEVAF